MKERKLIAKILSIACIITMVLTNATTSFATDSMGLNRLENQTTGLDISVTENINMEEAAGGTSLTVDNLEIINNSSSGTVNIDSISVTAVNGWILAGQDTDWAKLEADAKKIRLKADGSHDMATGAYTEAGTIDPGATDTTTFTGNTGLVTTAISDEKVADIVVTVSFVEAEDPNAIPENAPVIYSSEDFVTYADSPAVVMGDSGTFTLMDRTNLQTLQTIYIKEGQEVTLDAPSSYGFTKYNINNSGSLSTDEVYEMEHGETLTNNASGVSYIYYIAMGEGATIENHGAMGQMNTFIESEDITIINTYYMALGFLRTMVDPSPIFGDLVEMVYQNEIDGWCAADSSVNIDQPFEYHGSN